MTEPHKAFYSISETAEIIDVPQHVLRFWETKFSQIRPVKRAGNRRYYRQKDINLIKNIKNLLYTDGYTIRGVQKILKTEGMTPKMSAPASKAPKSAQPKQQQNNNQLSFGLDAFTKTDIISGNDLQDSKPDINLPENMISQVEMFPELQVDAAPQLQNGSHAETAILSQDVTELNIHGDKIQSSSPQPTADIDPVNLSIVDMSNKIPKDNNNYDMQSEPYRDEVKQLASAKKLERLKLIRQELSAVHETLSKLRK